MFFAGWCSTVCILVAGLWGTVVLPLCIGSTGSELNEWKGKSAGPVRAEGRLLRGVV